jgi:hypothetical protein
MTPRLQATFVTYGNAPGYRDVYVVGRVPNGREVEVRISHQDALALVRHILEVNDLAWHDGREPLDLHPGEKRPDWVVPHGTRRGLP